MENTEEKVLNFLKLEWQGVVSIMDNTKLPYYVVISILRDLEKQGLAETNIVGNVAKWRKNKLEVNNELRKM